MQTIVWDVDDVLNNLMEAWLEEAWKRAHPRCRVSFSEIRANPPHRVLGIAEAEYLTSLDEFRQSAAARRLQPNRAILDWFQVYGDCFRHVALTARPLGCTPHAADWLFRHFGRYIRCFGVVPSRPDSQAPLYDRHKGDFLAWLGVADFFVDDSPGNIRSVAALGIETVLYPQPWNRSTQTVDEVLNALTGKVVVS